MENQIVANEYKKNTLKEYRFEWNGAIYCIESEPYKLIIKQTNGDIYCSLDVDSYFDCGIFIGDIFFWGERLGRISGYSMSDKKICFRSYINSEAEAFYKEHASLYPFTFPPKSGSYDCLPEMNLADYIVSKISITVQTSYQNYLIVGDLSGHVSIFNVDKLQLVTTFSVDGAVAKVGIDGEMMIIDFIKSNRLCSPSSLSAYKEALRTQVRIPL